jgi:hypothetical protein
MSNGIRNRIGNYHYADGALRRRNVSGTDYVIGIAGAYNAFGLIGSEYNGIFILDDTNKRVILDEDTPQQTGYYGPSQAQWDRLEELTACSPEAFLETILTQPRSRLAGTQGAQR